MTKTPNIQPANRPERVEDRPTEELVGRFLEMELSEADEGLIERALVQMLARDTSVRPSSCFAGNVIRCLEQEERAASCWSQRTIIALAIAAIGLCGSGVLLLARLAGLPTAPGLDWLPILRAAWSTALEAPSALAAVLARFGGSWADAQSAVEWAYSPELLVLAGAALGVATAALGALARLMAERGDLETGDFESAELEALG